MHEAHHILRDGLIEKQKKQEQLAEIDWKAVPTCALSGALASQRHCTAFEASAVWPDTQTGVHLLQEEDS